MPNDNINVINPPVNPVNNDGPKHNFETSTKLMCVTRIARIEEALRTELKQHHERSANAKFLRQFMKALNQASNADGSVDLSTADIGGMVQKLRDLGVEVDPGKTYNKAERDMLMDNLRLTIEDLNMENDMQLQTIQRLTNEKIETVQIAREIMKKIHDDIINKTRKIAEK